MTTGAPLNRQLLSLAFCLCLSAADNSFGEIKDRIHFYEDKFNLPHNLLIAIAMTESRLNPWAVNIDGIPVFPTSKHDAVSILKAVASGNLYAIYLRKKGTRKSGFYSSAYEASINLSRYESENWKAIKTQGKIIRKINPRNSDICLMQLNYKYHGATEFSTVNDMFDIDRCIKYGAQFLSSLIKKHGLTKGIGCYNTCGSKATSVVKRNKYIASVMRNWSQ